MENKYNINNFLDITTNKLLDDIFGTTDFYKIKEFIRIGKIPNEKNLSGLQSFLLSDQTMKNNLILSHFLLLVKEIDNNLKKEHFLGDILKHLLNIDKDKISQFVEKNEEIFFKNYLNSNETIEIINKISENIYDNLSNNQINFLEMNLKDYKFARINFKKHVLNHQNIFSVYSKILKKENVSNIEYNKIIKNIFEKPNANKTSISLELNNIINISNNINNEKYEELLSLNKKSLLKNIFNTEDINEIKKNILKNTIINKEYYNNIQNIIFSKEFLEDSFLSKHIYTLIEDIDKELNNQSTVKYDFLYYLLKIQQTNQNFLSEYKDNFENNYINNLQNHTIINKISQRLYDNLSYEKKGILDRLSNEINFSLYDHIHLIKNHSLMFSLYDEISKDFYDEKKIINILTKNKNLYFSNEDIIYQDKNIIVKNYKINKEDNKEEIKTILISFFKKIKILKEKEYNEEYINENEKNILNEFKNLENNLEKQNIKIHQILSVLYSDEFLNNNKDIEIVLFKLLNFPPPKNVFTQKLFLLDNSAFFLKMLDEKNKETFFLNFLLNKKSNSLISYCLVNKFYKQNNKNYILDVYEKYKESLKQKSISFLNKEKIEEIDLFISQLKPENSDELFNKITNLTKNANLSDNNNFRLYITTLIEENRKVLNTEFLQKYIIENITFGLLKEDIFNIFFNIKYHNRHYENSGFGNFLNDFLINQIKADIDKTISISEKNILNELLSTNNNERIMKKNNKI